MSECRLYLITPQRLEDPRAFVGPLSAALDAGDVAAVQLRLKDVDDRTILNAAEILKPVVQQRGAAFIMNDRPDLAIKAGCDGVHLGQDDESYAEGRRILGDERIIGVTCHDSRHLAMEAAERGADYVAFGAFFPTTTKDPKAHAEVEIIRWWHDLMVVPCVAIGGITVGNCKPLIEAGADFLAVSAGVWNHKDGPAVAVQRFNELMGG